MVRGHGKGRRAESVSVDVDIHKNRDLSDGNYTEYGSASQRHESQRSFHLASFRTPLLAGFPESSRPPKVRLNPYGTVCRALAPDVGRTIRYSCHRSFRAAETPVLASWEPDNLLRNSWEKLKKHLAAAGFALALLIGPKSGIGLENIVERFRNRDKV